MRIALFGNGAMGQLVGTQAQAAGHEIGEVFTSSAAAVSLDDVIFPASRSRCGD